MKIDKSKIKNVKSAKLTLPKGKATKAKPDEGKPAKKSGKVTVGKAIALISGQRGFCARLVETHKQGETLSIRALQRNDGVLLRDGKFAEIKDGLLVGEKQARVELGGYVNGKSTGAKVELLTPAQFQARSKPCVVHWNADDNGIRGHYIGNPNVKGMVAVSVDYGKGNIYYWQMEQDSNSNNKHERGKILPLKKDDKLVACK